MYYWEGDMGGQMGWSVVLEGEFWRKGPWTADEDRLLIDYVRLHGEGRWNSVARLAGLKRNGKSCRLRWVNYLRPDLKRGQITPQEESIILDLHARWGNRWSTIARSLPGRTDNEIKNYWRTHFKKKSKGPSLDAAENKAKNRLMKKQQFHHQQQQLQQKLQQQYYYYQQQVQQQQQFEFNLDMMKGVMAMLENNNSRIVPYDMPQIMKQEMVNKDPYYTTEEQGYFYSMINANNNASVLQASNEEIVWDGMWNIDDDVHGNFSIASATSKSTLHNLVAPFC